MHSIRSFRPFETKQENTNQDRTVLRLLDGMVAVPIGALASGPEWKSMWGITDLPATAALVLAAADAGKAHLFTIRRGNHVFIVVWSLAISKPLGLFYVTAGTPTDFDFDSADVVTLASPVNTAYRDKDGTAPWFASRIGPRWYLGNGVDPNLQWHGGALSLLGPTGVPTDIYDMSRYRLPPCTTFIVGGTNSIFASGNAVSPKRVWVVHPPTKDFTWNEGVYSLDTSFIDLDYTDATKITALSAFQNYITAHTDAKPVNMFDVDGSEDGWKCVQSPGAANSSAPCPAAVRDTNGLASFYVGTDGEVYEDQAIRVGPSDKRPARDQDIASRLGAGDWNRDMQKPLASGLVHCAYDRLQQMFWTFAELDGFPGRFGLWAYNERTKAMMGPYTHINATHSCAISGNIEGTATVVAVILATGEMLYSELSNIGEIDEFMNEAANVPLLPEYEILTAVPTPAPGMSYVAMTATNRQFAHVLAGGESLIMVDPWSYFEPEGDYEFTKFFNNAHLARFETGYMDFGREDLLKNYLELRMTWQKHSRAYVGLYAETEEGRRGGKWHGLVFNKETHRVPLNLCGHRIRVRGVVVLFNSAPGLLRDVSIGWLPAGTS